MDWLDKIKEFIQQFLSSEIIQKVIEILETVIDVIKKLWDWLYGTVTGFFG